MNGDVRRSCRCCPPLGKPSVISTAYAGRMRSDCRASIRDRDGFPRVNEFNPDFSPTKCAGDEEIANRSSRKIVSTCDERPTERAKCPLG